MLGETDGIVQKGKTPVRQSADKVRPVPTCREAEAVTRYWETICREAEPARNILCRGGKPPLK